MADFGSHLNVDLQQRGIEYNQLFKKHQGLRPAIMERIPALDRPVQSEHMNGSGGVANGENELLMDDLYPSRQMNQSNQNKESVRMTCSFIL